MCPNFVSAVCLLSCSIFSELYLFIDLKLAESAGLGSKNVSGKMQACVSHREHFLLKKQRERERDCIHSDSKTGVLSSRE